MIPPLKRLSVVGAMVFAVTSMSVYMCGKKPDGGVPAQNPDDSKVSPENPTIAPLVLEEDAIDLEAGINSKKVLTIKNNSNILTAEYVRIQEDINAVRTKYDGCDEIRPGQRCTVTFESVGPLLKPTQIAIKGKNTTTEYLMFSVVNVILKANNPQKINLIAGGKTEELIIENTSKSVFAENVDVKIEPENSLLVLSANNCAQIENKGSCVVSIAAKIDAETGTNEIKVHGKNTNEITIPIEVSRARIELTQCNKDTITSTNQSCKLYFTQSIKKKSLTIKNTGNIIAENVMIENIPESIQVEKTCTNLEPGKECTINLIAPPVTPQIDNNFIVKAENSNTLSNELTIISELKSLEIANLSNVTLINQLKAPEICKDTQKTFDIKNTTDSNVRIKLEGSALESTGIKIENRCQNALNSGESCAIVFTPNNEDTETKVLKIIGVLEDGDSLEPIDVNVRVIGYGSEYQDGYVYSLSCANQQFTGGKAVSIQDLGPTKWWTSGSPVKMNDYYSGGPNVTMAFESTFSGTKNGIENFNAINTCYVHGRGFGEWYLPAICELGVSDNSVSKGAECVNNPENIVEIMIKFGKEPNLIQGNYWSSSGILNGSQGKAWMQAFAFSANNFKNTQIQKSRSDVYKIRCVRDISP